MSNLFLFDVDGTLAESTQKIEDCNLEAIIDEIVIFNELFAKKYQIKIKYEFKNNLLIIYRLFTDYY